VNSPTFNPYQQQIDTLEEKILEMQAKKQVLAEGVYGDRSSEDSTKLTAKDLQELLGIE